jgi:exonuclease SbcD
MRLLHTSDWHLGRSFHGASLLDEQAEALNRIVELAQQQAVDLVVIAGDLYDRAIPPAEAVQLFTATLARLRRADIAVVAIAGNHDSHVRVSVYDPLLSALGVTIRGEVGRLREPVLVLGPKPLHRRRRGRSRRHWQPASSHGSRWTRRAPCSGCTA